MAELIKLKKFAERAGVHPDTAIKWLKKPENRISPVLKNGRYYVKSGDFERFFSNQELDEFERNCNPVEYEIERFIEDLEGELDASYQYRKQSQQIKSTDELIDISTRFQERVLSKLPRIYKRRSESMAETRESILRRGVDYDLS